MVDRSPDQRGPTLRARRLTAPLPSAIGSIEVCGEHAEALVLSLARLKTRKLRLGRIYFGTWPLDLETGPQPQPADAAASAAEHVVVCQVRPSHVEIHCHGNALVLDKILRQLEAAGCVVEGEEGVEQGSRDTVDSLSAQAWADLSQSQTDRTAAILLDQAQGALDAEIAAIQQAIRAGNFSSASAGIEQLLARSDVGLHLLNPWKFVLAGPPNVGKSSLLNAMVGDQRAIVHQTPGTTRDVVEACVAVDGWLITLSDTAGVRDALDPIEREGVLRTRQRLAEADAVLLVVDASIGWTAAHDWLLAESPPRRLIVWNKRDLAEGTIPDRWHGISVVPTIAADTIAPTTNDQSGHAERDRSIGELLNAMIRLLDATIPPGAGVPFRSWQVEHLRSARDALHAGRHELALEWLQRLVHNRYDVR